MKKVSDDYGYYHGNQLKKWEYIELKYEAPEYMMNGYEFRSLEMQADCNLVLYDVCFLFYSLLNLKTLLK